MAKPARLAVLLSGGGTTLQNILDRIDARTLDATVAVVISSRSDAYGLDRARKRNIPAVVVRSKDYANFERMSEAIAAEIEKYPVDLIVMAGFMCFFKVPEKYIGRTMNIHPALVPAFCGKGYYGHRVHEAVLRYGAKVSG